jgi:large subunit ribosomal protein L15
MLKLNDLRPNKGARKKIVRVGRGHASGFGQQAGRGHKGAQSRSGTVLPYQGHEGGQKPLYKKMPKLKGFGHYRRTEYAIVNLADLADLKNSAINLQVLQENGLVSKKAGFLKVLGTGEIKQAYTVQAHKISESAKSKIEKAGGKVELVSITKTTKEK